MRYEQYIDPYVAYMINGKDIYEACMADPGNITKFRKQCLVKLSGQQLCGLLIKHPQLLPYLKEHIHIININAAAGLLNARPQLFPYFKTKIFRLHPFIANLIVASNPMLALCFKYRNTEYFDAACYITFPEAYEDLTKEQQLLVNEQIAKLMELENART